VRPLIVGPGTKTGMPILYENPKEVGADRIVNAVAAYTRFRTGCIVVDFGTATTFDCVSPAGEYLGGVIAPGITISADALYRHAAKLPRVEVDRPPQVVGRNTVASIQSGLFYGYVGLVDGIVGRMSGECGFPVKVVATGGQARLIAKASSTIEEVDELLTLAGLKLLYDLNHGVEGQRGGAGPSGAR
jgi:type III pantothenate kinase